MNRTKYIIQRIEQIELKMSRRLKLNHPVKKKNKWLRNILMDIHREDEMELIKCKMRLPIDDYSLLKMKG